MDSQKCPNCGELFDPADAGGLCPRCLAILGTGAPPEPPPGRFAGKEPLPTGRIHYFGDYELLEKIDHGGMGVVYRARQVSLNREVAVKLILAGAFASEDFLRRFRDEAETMGKFRHPNIVAIYEVGEHEGQPYFAMEYVAGKTLAKLNGPDSLPPREAAGLMITVARAVHYVHERGVLHRDLKPSNVLWDELGQPHVTDFGVAKRLDQLEEFTLTGQVLGAPAFMSPEHVSRQFGGITIRTDVYGLGAILYYLVSGQPPFPEKTAAEIFKAVAEEDPLPPRQLNPSLPADLETICLKCLSKEPARRYANAEEFARDLECWLAGKPILARPPGLLGRQWLLIKRNPVVSTLCAILALSVLVGGAGILREWRLSERNWIRAEVARREMVTTTQRIQVQKAVEAEELFKRHKPHEALTLLATNARMDPSNRVFLSRLQAALSARSFVQPMTPPLDDGSSLFYAQMSPDGTRIVTSDMGNHMRFWDAMSGQPAGLAVGLSGKLEQFAFSGDGRILMTLITNEAVCFWDARTVEPQRRFPCRGSSAAADLSPDGFFVAVGMTNGQIVVFDRRRPDHEDRWSAHAATVNWVEFSRDGRFLVTGSDDHMAKLWDVPDGFKFLVSVDQGSEIGCLNLSPDGARLITFGATNSPRVWEIPSGRLITTLNGPTFTLTQSAFSPDGARIVLGTTKGDVFLFDAATGGQLLRYEGHANMCMAACFSPDGQRVASCGADNTARIWDVHTGKALVEPIRHEDLVSFLQFDPNGERLMTGSPVGGVRLWDVFPRAALPLRMREREPALCSAFSPDGTELWTISNLGAVRVWNTRTASLVRTIRENGSNQVCWAAFDQGLARAVCGAGDNHFSLLNLTTGSNTTVQVPIQGVMQVKSDFSPDGRKVAFSSGDEAFVYDTDHGQLLAGPLHCPSAVERVGHNLHFLEFSPDGRKLAAACHEFHALVWDAANGALLADFPHQGPVETVEFSPDGARLLTASADNLARIWGLTNSTTPLRVFHHHDFPMAAVFSDDGRSVLTGTYGNQAFLWDAGTGAQLGLAMLHEHWTRPVALSPSGSEALTRCDGGYFRRWDAQTGLPLSEPYATTALPFVKPSSQWDAFAACVGSEAVQVWRETPPTIPCPAWLPSLAEGIAGLRYATNGTEESVPTGEFLALKEKLLRSSDTDAWTQWAKWFLSDVRQRTISWDSPMTMQAYIDSLIKEDRLDDLRQALIYAPTNGVLLAHLARRTLAQTNNPCRMVEADFLSRRAMQFAPQSAEVAKLRAEIAAKIPLAEGAKK